MEEHIQCYICYENETPDNIYLKEVLPCMCKGSNIIHKECLKEIIKTSRICSICKTKYNKEYLPYSEGKELIMEVLPSGDKIEYTVNENGEKHGTFILRNKEERLLVLHSYINGIMEGPYIEYYTNGQIKCVCKCRNNKIEGEYTEWQNDGTIIEESNYKDGKKDGECVRWVWENDCRVAMALIYEDGEIKE